MFAVGGCPVGRPAGDITINHIDSITIAFNNTRATGFANFIAPVICQMGANATGNKSQFDRFIDAIGFI